MPSEKAVHIDRALTNISLRFTNAAFIGETMFPVLPVKKESDKYFTYGKEHFRRHGTLRANGARSNEYVWTVSDTSYQCEEYALHTPVTDREKKNADAPIKPDIDATESLTDAIKLDWEVRYQTLAGAAASFATGHSATPTIRWDAANATIALDVKLGQETIRQAIARYPNYIFIPSLVAMYMSEDDEIKEIIKYTHSDLLKVKPGSWVLPPMLWGMKVVVAMSIQDTANEAQEESLSDIWSDNVVMAYINKGPGLKKLSWGYTFQNRNWQTKKWREEARESDIVEVSVIRDARIVCTTAAYELSDTLT